MLCVVLFLAKQDKHFLKPTLGKHPNYMRQNLWLPIEAGAKKIKLLVFSQ